MIMPNRTSTAAKRATLLLLGLATLGATSPSRAYMSIYGLYDLRHSTDPEDNAENFPVIEMKGFFPLTFGNFFFKEEIDLDGTKDNQSEVYSELDQSFKLGRATLWGSPLLLHLGYSGGLGVLKNAAGGYYVQSAYNIGPEQMFSVAGATCDIYASLRYTDMGRPSYDPEIAFYVGRSFFEDKLLIANSLEAWTGPSTVAGSGKVASLELESEVWYTIANHISVGTYIRTTRNVYVISIRSLVYPSVGVRYSF